MDSLLALLQRYLQDTLGLTTAPRAWAGAARLPAYLRQRYAFATAQLLDEHCLLLLDCQPEVLTPGRLGKDLAAVQDRWPHAVVYVSERVSAYNRKRLIELKTPFIVPGNQLYLPTLGLDLREHLARARAPRAPLSPPAQRVLLYLLLARTPPPHMPSALAEALGYSRMTLTRVLSELVAGGLIEAVTRGRHKELLLPQSRHDIWEQAQPLLRDPVKRRLQVGALSAEGAGVMARAGLTALAHYSSLAPPARPVYAVGPATWRQWQGPSGLEVLEPEAGEGACEVEIWRYPPQGLTDLDVVDPLSLALSLRGDEDERIASAVAETIGGLRW